MIENNEMKKMKAKSDAVRMMLNMLAEATNDPKVIFKKAEVDFHDKLSSIALNMKVITDDQYKDLTNMVKQFDKVIDDYLRENNIKLKEEN